MRKRENGRQDSRCWSEAEVRLWRAAFSILDVGFSILGAGFSILGAGFSILDAGFSIRSR